MEVLAIMNNQAHQKIKDLLIQYTTVGIILPKNPTIDHVAAGLGLYLAIRQMGKQIMIASPTQPIVEISTLVGINNIKNMLGSEDSDLTVSFPYIDGEIEKVSYNLDKENNLLHIVVKAGDKGLSFQEKEIQFKRGGKIPQLVFFVGVPLLSDLGNFFNRDSFKDTVIVNIDNHSHNEGFGNVSLISSEFSSISEQVAYLLTHFEGQIDIDLDISQNLLTGISSATNDFQDQKTSYLAFEMAGILLKKGATRQRVSHSVVKDESNSAFFPYRPQQPPVQPFATLPRQQSFNQPMQRVIQSSQQSQGSMQSSKDQQVSQQNQLQGDTKQQPKQTPPDWLTPKVYKGSSVLS